MSPRPHNDLGNLPLWSMSQVLKALISLCSSYTGLFLFFLEASRHTFTAGICFHFLFPLPDTLFFQVWTLSTSSPPSALISWGIVSVGPSQTSPGESRHCLATAPTPCLLFLPQCLPLADTLGAIRHRLFRLSLHVLTCTPLTTGVSVGYV